MSFSIHPHHPCHFLLHLSLNFLILMFMSQRYLLYFSILDLYQQYFLKNRFSLPFLYHYQRDLSRYYHHRHHHRHQS